MSPYPARSGCRLRGSSWVQQNTALARSNKPETEIRAEAKQKNLSKADEDMEVYRNHHFAAHALTRLLTDNREWSFGFEDYFKRIAVPTTILVADHKAGGAIMREEMSYLQGTAPPQVKFEFWENTGHGMKSAKPAEYNKALDEWLKD